MSHSQSQVSPRGSGSCTTGASCLSSPPFHCQEKAWRASPVTIIRLFFFLKHLSKGHIFLINFFQFLSCKILISRHYFFNIFQIFFSQLKQGKREGGKKHTTATHEENIKNKLTNKYSTVQGSKRKIRKNRRTTTSPLRCCSAQRLQQNKKIINK